MPTRPRSAIAARSAADRASPCAEQQVVGRAAAPRRASRSARRVHAVEVAEEGAAPRLVEVIQSCTRSPSRPATTRGVVGEASAVVARRPAAAVLQRLRQVPVVQRGPRVDARGQQRVDQPVVEVEARPG